MRLLRQRIPAIGMNTECKYHHKSRAASVEILDETTKILDYHLVSYPGTRGEFPCWTPGRHKRGILLLDAETTKQVPRLSLGVIPRHQRWMPLLDARAAPEGNRQLHIIMWHLTWFFLFFAAWQSRSLRLSCKIAKRNQVICWSSRKSHGVGMQFESSQWTWSREKGDGWLPSGVMALLRAKEV